VTCNNADFGKQENPRTASSPASMQDNSTGIIIKYFLHGLNSDSLILIWPEVISANGLCPAFNGCPNSNIFQHHFGIDFCHEGCSYIRAILPFEFVFCFHFIDQLTYRLSQAAMPVRTSAWLFKQVHAYLVYLEMQILSSSCGINLLPPLLPYKHLSMAQLALGFPLGIDGSGPIWTIRR
jgi:hypothetical protein